MHPSKREREESSQPKVAIDPQKETESSPSSFDESRQGAIPFEDLTQFFNERLFDKKLFVLSDIVEPGMPCWGHVKSVVKAAVNHTKALNGVSKKRIVLSALASLAKNEHLTTQRKRYILSAIECFLLSSRITYNTRALGIFSKHIVPGYQHSWTWEGIKLALSTEHPHLNVHFILYPLGLTAETWQLIKLGLQKKVIWIVVGNERHHDLSLINMQLINNELIVRVFDSHSPKYFASEIYQLIDTITSELGVHDSIIEAFAEARDPVAHLNFYVLSLYYVLSDLNTALSIIQAEKPLFWGEPIESQVSKRALLKTFPCSKNPLFAYKFDSPFPAISNGIATLEKLVTKNKIAFRADNEEEDSENEDEEIGQYSEVSCSLM